jgi:glycosyltransferase involved in cell wall biosynthesis
MKQIDKTFFIVILPFFNEGELIIDLLKILEFKISKINDDFKLIFVNDGSTDNGAELIDKYNFQSQNISKELIELNSNAGHQNAIRQGIIYAKQNHIDQCKGIIIMDSDGEDNPDALAELANKRNYDVVFVTRGKRKENLTFKISYFFYKILFKIITGKKINFGNYALISPKVLNAIAEKHFFHFSSFLSKQRFNIEYIQYDRNKRLKGKTKMGFKNLLIHALKSFIEYHEELIFFQVKVFIFILIAFTGMLTYVIYEKYISHTAILGWSSTLLIGLINGILIMFSTIIISTLLMTLKNAMDQKNIYHKTKENKNDLT